MTEPSDKPTYVLPKGGIGAQGGTPYADAGAGSLEQAKAAAEQTGTRQFFFPKAFNEEQSAIVQRLESPDVEGVVVQGPPGTGKTHTIANIICHYLATGRRVLVTSKSEGALAVLRDQIPEGIRDLAISLLTSEREGLKQLEATVNLLASKVASLDTRTMERDISDSERRIAELERRIAKVDAELRAFAEKHLRRIDGDADTDGILPIELAERIVRDRDRYAWLSDRPEFSNALKLSFGDEDERLFPYGLSAVEIVSDAERARHAAESIRTEVSRHRLSSARIKLAAAGEKLATCTGRISTAGAADVRARDKPSR